MNLNSISAVLAVMTHKRTKELRNMVETLSKEPPEITEERRKAAASAPPLGVFALALVLTYRNPFTVLRAILEAIGMEEQEIRVSEALTELIKEVV